ncbi:MAG: mechanosensitive ion channel [Streptosporangiales bacterium]|nr:mechanosensitive ion channel [Streptosporangiales bacterium]
MHGLPHTPTLDAREAGYGGVLGVSSPNGGRPHPLHSHASREVTDVQGWIALGATVLVAVAIVEVARRIMTSRMASRWPFTAEIVRRCTKPAFATAAIIGALIGLVAVNQGDYLARYEPTLEHGLVLALTAATLWLIVQAGYVGTDIWLDNLAKLGDPEDPEYRRLRTQVLLLRRLAAATAAVIAAGVVLFSFPGVRAVGAGLLASAGLAGIIAGLAARSTLGNLMAGLQLAFSNALRIGDIVVVEERWGWVEEITLTYVVVRAWTGPRMILPVSYFTENPFEAWSRQRHEFVGTVYLRVDWMVPIEEVRQELYRFVHASPLWDQRDCVLNITDVLPDGTVELRALMSTHDWASNWDLRCDVREHLVTFLREHYPSALPRLRAELVDPTKLTGDGSGRIQPEP